MVTWTNALMEEKGNAHIIRDHHECFIDTSYKRENSS